MDQQGKILIDTSDTDYYISADLNNTSKQWDLTYSTINLQGDYVLNIDLRFFRIYDSQKLG